MNNKVIALLLAGIISSGLIYSHPAYAHNFGGDESAGFLAKVQEIKTELNQISKNLSNHDAVAYYIQATGEYWNGTYDTQQMAERNTLLAQEIPNTLNAIYAAANATSPDASTVNTNIQKLNGYLDEAVPVRVDKDKLNNATVNALAVTFVLKESLEKYGDAINSTVSLNDMSQMKMSGMQSSMSVPIVDENKYENAKALAATAQNMFNDLQTKYPNVAQNSKIASEFAKLIQDLNNKANGNTIIVDVHMNIHPSLVDGYQLLPEAVPEFPLPLLLIVIAFSGIIFATKMKTKIGLQ